MSSRITDKVGAAGTPTMGNGNAVGGGGARERRGRVGAAVTLSHAAPGHSGG